MKKNEAYHKKNITRRDFVKNTTMTASGLLLGSLPLSSSAYAAGRDMSKAALVGSGGSSRLMHSEQHYSYHYAEVQNVQNLPEPEGMRVPFNWPTMVVPPAGSHQWPLLTWHGTEAVEKSKPCSLRLSVALDVREEKIIEVILANSGEVIGEFDIRYAPVNQIQTAYFETRYIPEVLEHGVRLRMTKGDSPLWFVAPDKKLHENAGVHPPHLMFPGTSDPMSAFYDRMFSLDSIQAFGWMEGCVTDALWDLSRIPRHAGDAEKALHSHFQMFLKGDDLVYESPRSRISDNIIHDVEATLPFATLAMIYPDHPSLDLAVDFWLKLYDRSLPEPETNMITAEGSYTVAYPMMTIGKLRSNEKLVELAIERLRIRRDWLRHENALYLRRRTNDIRSFRNWSRAVSWYLLGLTRSLIILDTAERPDDLILDLQEVAGWAIDHQLESGLWRCFIDERGIREDTSGSAGIAAALAMGARNGLLTFEAENAAKKTMYSLTDYLTDDGLLAGVAQSNRFGERLQRDDYRVTYQMGMGLMGQLIAALE